MMTRAKTCTVETEDLDDALYFLNYVGDIHDSFANEELRQLKKKLRNLLERVDVHEHDSRMAR